MQTIELLDLLKAGVHFGHQKSRWHPKMKQYIFTVRSGVHIIDLEKTAHQLQIALEYIQKLMREGKILLVVGTKRQAQPIIEQKLAGLDIPYVTQRWIGGTLTNFDNIKRLTEKLNHLTREQAGGGLEKYTKKEQMEFAREIKKLESEIGGIKNLKRIPDALFVIDVKTEATAIREAKRKKIPVIAMVDTNCNPDGIAYPIPSNDDATKAIELIMSYVVSAIQEGKPKPVAAPVAPTVA